MKHLTLTVCALVLALGTGCYKTKIQLKPEPAVRQAGEHYHLSLINIIELSSPIDLAAECGGPGNAVEIDEQVGPLGVIVNMFLSYWIPILHVHNATVGCGGGGGAPPPMAPPPADGAPPPPPAQ